MLIVRSLWAYLQGACGIWILALVAGANSQLAMAQEGAPAPEKLTTTKIAGEEPQVPDNVRQLMQDRKYSEAIAAIDAITPKAEVSRDYVAYLRGRALHLAEKYEEAVKAYEDMIARFPQSPWVRRARFAKGVSLARKGDFRAAELVYKAEAEFLTSLTRKQDVADIYLEFADAFYKPAKEDQQPDYQQALDFYKRALDVGMLVERRIQIELRVAQCQQQLGDHSEAIKLYQKFLKDYPGDALAVEARFLLGESQLVTGDPSSARRTWQDLLALHPGAKSGRLPEAAFRLSETYGLPEPNDEEDLNLGVAALASFLERYPDHQLAPKAQLRIAESYQYLDRHEAAIERIKTFLADPRYAVAKEIPEARRRLGYSYLYQKKFDEALAAWREYLVQHPTDSAWAQVQAQIIEAEYLRAEMQFQEKNYDAARRLWGEFLVKYPLDERGRKILFNFGLMLSKEEKWNESIEQWRRLVSKYPGTDEAAHAQYAIAVTLEENVGRLDDALKEYRKLDWGGHFVQRARQRIARLTTKQMVLATERVFRSDETPWLKLTTRNIENVKVQVYAIDLETYFRKMHGRYEVENLDITLIDPDRTQEFKVPNYQQYRELESEIEVPLVRTGDMALAGAMAVTVTSQTLEATTLVLQSDLDVIVKASQNEVFVFAENMHTGKPWPGVRILVSDEQQVFAEGETGPDGVFHREFRDPKEPRTIQCAHVFASAGSHVAFSQSAPSGGQAPQGLADKGYIYTDRPAYRAGQMVNVRGVIRKVAGDTYTVVAGKKYDLDVYDNRSRLVHHDAVALGDFGSFHAHFALPESSQQGQYRVHVHDDEGESYQGTFIVHDYSLEPVRLEVDAPRTVYYRGEEIEGTIRAKYYYGAPLADREIRYQIDGDRSFTTRTDDQGEVKFKLPTREYRESQTLQLQVELPERNLAITQPFFLSTQGFSIQASTVRPVYLAGDTFELSVKTLDAEQKPIAQPLELSVLERTVVAGKVGERQVQRHELQTEAQDGTGRITLRLEKGGKYLLRLEGTDRFKNPITAQAAVQISDDEDEVRLRILADRHTYKAGDKASVVLHWREQPALALVTYQGARILGYKLVELQSGANKLEVPMTAELAPNFELAVAVMTDVRKGADKPAKQRAAENGADKEQATKRPPLRFHAASSPFSVERDLTVKLTLAPAAGAKGPPRPGDSVQVTITTLDPQGRPVAAEVSLAMVEQALLARFASPVAGIGDYFRGGMRRSAVGTQASVGFDYRPTTRSINARLLAEADRLAVAEEEEKRLDLLRSSGRLSFAADPFGGRANEVGMPYHSFEGSDGSVALEQLASRVQDEVLELESGEMLLGAQTLQSLSDSQRSATEGMTFGLYQELQSAQQAQDRSYWGARRQPQRRGQERNIDGVSQGEFLDADGDENGKLADVSGSGQAYFHRPSTRILKQLKDIQLGEVQVLTSNGTLLNMNFEKTLGGRWDDEKAETLVAQLNAEGAVLVADRRLQETGYWNPAVVTDKDGQATLTITLPERSTAWQLLARGVTRETLAGEATDELTVKKDLFGDLKLPMAFTDGDEAEVIASVHNDLVDNGTITVTLKTTIGEKSTTETKTLDVKAKGIREIVYRTQLAMPEAAAASSAPGATAQLELSVSSGMAQDVVRRSVPIRPFGLPVFAVDGGTAESDMTAFVQPPVGMKFTSPTLQVILGPTVEQSLVDALLAPATWCQMETGMISSGVDTAASDLMTGLGLAQLLAATRQPVDSQAEAVDARIRSSVNLLVSMQNNDGGWSWSGRSRESHRYSTARVVWSLRLAQSAGFRVPEDTLNGAVAYLQTQLAATSVSDFETKAILLHALEVAGRGDFPLANQLYRNRPSLSTVGLVHLALAFAAMDRKQTSAELLAMVVERKLNDPATKRQSALGPLPWNHAESELRALYAVALDQVTPTDAHLAEQVQWLQSHRTGHRWNPDKATGPAMLALCRWYARTKFQGERYKLNIFVNDLLAHTLDITAESRTQTLDIPAKLLDPKGGQRVRFEITGRGRFSYQCVLGGFVPAEQLASTTTDWKVTRTYEPAPLELDGKAVARGFDVLAGGYTAFRNELNQLPVARRGHVELRVTRQNLAAGTPTEQLEYLVATEPLPAGATVIEQSVSGGFERFEIGPGAITFYIGSRAGIAPIQYDLHGYLPGDYRMVPTLVRNAYRADQIAVSEVKKIAVLPLGAESTDKYRLSPRELFELGRRHFDKGDFAVAGRHLAELVKGWNLASDTYKETARMLLEVYLKQGPAPEVVRYFEIVIEKYPELEIPFAKLMQVGDAYHQIGEYERSYLVLRAVVEASFLRESQVAGFLEDRGEFLRSVDVMSAMLRQYPPEAYLAAATYALAQRVYAKAPQAAEDAKLRETNVTRVDLIRRSLAMLDGFLTAHPDDPAADEASFSLASGLLELEVYQQAIAAAQRYAVRFPKSDFLDSYWYIIGFSHFARGEHEQALAMCSKVAEAKRINRQTGREEESPNKWRAIYILGQIHHSLGQAAAAIAEYTRVKDRFADARAAIEYFARKEIKLPEVSTFRPGEVASVELKFRNLPTCDAKVYRIDLMRFSLLKRNLEGITEINLSGIHPYHEATIELGDGKDYRDRTKPIPLPLKEQGAYLVVCRGGDLYASGLVLISPLVAEVQEDATSGEVRATIRDVTKESYVPDVHVKVIGSYNSDFVSGNTDLRGVFVADAIQGTSTVIAQADQSRYAFFRGKTTLGTPPQPASSTKKSESPAEGKSQSGKYNAVEELLEGIKGGNKAIQMEQQKELENLYRNDVKGGVQNFKF